MATLKSYKADISSVSPSSEWLTKGLHLQHQLCNSSRWLIYIINSVVKTKLPCYTLPLMQHYSFFRNLLSLLQGRSICDNHPTYHQDKWCRDTFYATILKIMVLFLAGLLEMEWYSFCHVYGIKKNTEPPTINQTQELEILLSSLHAILSTMLIIAVWRVLHMSKHSVWPDSLTSSL